MNSDVRPIFNESFVEKKKVCGSREQCTEPTENALALLKCASQKKKKTKNKTQTQDSAFQHYPNGHLVKVCQFNCRENYVIYSIAQFQTH